MLNKWMAIPMAIIFVIGYVMEFGISHYSAAIVSAVITFVLTAIILKG